MGLILTVLVKTETVLYTSLLVLATVMLWWLCFSMGLMLTFFTVTISPMLKQSHLQYICQLLLATVTLWQSCCRTGLMLTVLATSVQVPFIYIDCCWQQ
jgi:hypothetical protein